ncbi:hypothetical protein BKA63DRAFT_257910 [Paraphoma chrysanthemicola]|nr:hypothetical protein BKA63DRAFT_257910 [Paraphoma chrysanthemicola]
MLTHPPREPTWHSITLALYIVVDCNTPPSQPYLGSRLSYRSALGHSKPWAVPSGSFFSRLWLMVDVLSNAQKPGLGRFGIRLGLCRQESYVTLCLWHAISIRHHLRAYITWIVSDAFFRLRYVMQPTTNQILFVLFNVFNFVLSASSPTSCGMHRNYTIHSVRRYHLHAISLKKPVLRYCRERGARVIRNPGFHIIPQYQITAFGHPKHPPRKIHNLTPWIVTDMIVP